MSTRQPLLVFLEAACISLIAGAQVSFAQQVSSLSPARVPEFFAARFQIDVPEWPAEVGTRRIEIECDRPFSCLFQVGKDDPVRYESVATKGLIDFANGSLDYARTHPERFFTTRTDWNERFLSPLLSSSVRVNECIHLDRREYPGGNIFMCSINVEPWATPAVILIGELKVSYPELFFGTTLFPAFKVGLARQN